MYTEIKITQLNDFIFCPASIYFHNLYGSMDKTIYQDEAQLMGTQAHQSIDHNTYSTRKDILTGIDVYCEKYGLIGKIDLYYAQKGLLVERKRQIKHIYDGYIFQLYAQCFALREMGYPVWQLQLYSMIDNKKYPVLRPEEDRKMMYRFEHLIESMRSFTMDSFVQKNAWKCQNCIYEPACDRSKAD